MLNGRVAARPRVTGVERWARELIPRLRSLRPERYVALAPSPSQSNRAGQPWEQVVLPARAARIRASLIWSPANLAPIAWPRNVIVVHDAAVWREPQAYSSIYAAWHQTFGSLVIRRATTVITVSEFSRQELIRLAGVDESKLVVIGGGVDQRFHPGADHDRVRAKLGLGQPYVLTLGTADRRKNIDALGPVAQRLRSLGIALAWAGDSRDYIRSELLAGDLLALGYVNEADLPGLYGGALAFVLPSRYEGLGLPCLEAMACGVPVIAANRGALPETCGGAAVLVDPDDPQEIEEQVERVVSDDGLARRLRAAGLRRAAEARWDRTAAKLDELLIQLAERVPERFSLGSAPRR